MSLTSFEHDVLFVLRRDKWKTPNVIADEIEKVWAKKRQAETTLKSTGTPTVPGVDLFNTLKEFTERGFVETRGTYGPPTRSRSWEKRKRLAYKLTYKGGVERFERTVDAENRAPEKNRPLRFWPPQLS